MKKRIRLYTIFLLLILLLGGFLVSVELGAERVYAKDGFFTAQGLSGEKLYMLENFQETQKGDTCIKRMEISVPDGSLCICMMNPKGFELRINGLPAASYSRGNDNIYPLEQAGTYTLVLMSPRLARVSQDDAGLYIGSERAASRVLERRYCQRAFVVGANVMALLYSISLYRNKPTEKYLLCFMAYAILTSYRTAGRAFPSLGASFPFTLISTPWPIGGLSHPVSGALKHVVRSFLNPCLRYLLIREFLPKGSGRYMRYVAGGFAAALAMIFLCPADGVLLGVGYVYKISVFLIELWALTGMERGISSMAWAWILALPVMFVEFMDKMGFVHSMLFTQFGTTGIYESFLVLAFLLAVNRRFADKFKEADYLSKSLETAVAEKTAQLRESYALLQKSQEEQAMFFSDIAHNLKTPLFSLSGYTDMLLGALQEDEPRARRYGENIRSTADYMKKLLESLLLSMRLSGRNVEFSRDIFSPGEMLQQIRESMLPKAAARGIDILVPESVSKQKWVCDSFYLFQALQNLVENAIECGREGGYVRLSLAIDEDALYIFVEDDGIGIAEEDFPHIFERYYSRRRDGRKSSGLGLGIVKDIVEQQGGRILAESKPGEGSRFTLSFPAP